MIKMDLKQQQKSSKRSLGRVSMSRGMFNIESNYQDDDKQYLGLIGSPVKNLS